MAPTLSSHVASRSRSGDDDDWIDVAFGWLGPAEIAVEWPYEFVKAHWLLFSVGAAAALLTACLCICCCGACGSRGAAVDPRRDGKPAPPRAKAPDRPAGMTAENFSARTSGRSGMHF